MAAPVTNTDPSRAYASVPSGLPYAMVVSRPACEATASSPVFTSTNEPVP